jgi:hypothetical protein
MDWKDRVLADVPEDVAARYAPMRDYLDRALAGIDDDAKVNALRAMVNLGVDPNDEMNIVIALLGYFTAMGQTIPAEMRAVLPEMQAKLEQFCAAVEQFDENAKAMVERAVDEVERRALEFGKAAVQSAGVDETEKFRARLVGTMNGALAEFRAGWVAEAKAGTTAIVARKQRVVGAAVGAAIVVVGCLTGWVVASWRAPVSSGSAFYERQGEAYVRMWNDR